MHYLCMHGRTARRDATGVASNFVGHFSSWQAARVEVQQDEQVEQAVELASEAEEKVTGALPSPAAPVTSR